MPGEMYGHQSFAHGDNVFTMGGRVGIKPTDKCWMFHIQSADVESIVKLDQPRYRHTIHHILESIKAYIVAGRGSGDVDIKSCLVFDILNLKFDVVGSLKKGRAEAGVVST